MKIEKTDINGNKKSIDISDSVFKSKINKTLISNVIYKLNTNYKGRKAKTKQKNEIIGSTSKIYAQKGTGNARHASRKAPIFVGGGVAHGPKGESKYKKRKMSKSEKKNSVVSLLSEKVEQKKIIILNDISNEIKKTKDFFSILNTLQAQNSLLIFDKSSKDKIYKSSKNIPNVKLTDINHFSSYDLVKYEKLILTETSLKEIESRYS
ncbi:MAG: 50S ribosomal protein L4 [Candidatus Pelagibacter sp. TMED118]|nr:MAG: 50S ribosomal protein L4 [Candidatus Pelagibacter sp. TMED118]|tara:strand:+ start:1644 stop:2267 length:624 start_codon:yes stop_codon:yes gene_type:complete